MRATSMTFLLVCLLALGALPGCGDNTTTDAATPSATTDPAPLADAPATGAGDPLADLLGGCPGKRKGGCEGDCSKCPSSQAAAKSACGGDCANCPSKAAAKSACSGDCANCPGKAACKGDCDGDCTQCASKGESAARGAGKGECSGDCQDCPKKGACSGDCQGCKKTASKPACKGSCEGDCKTCAAKQQAAAEMLGCVCAQGKAGEPVWCDVCDKGYVDGKPAGCKGCVAEAKQGRVKAGSGK